MADMLPLNTPAPDFTLPNADEQPVKLSEYRGKNVVMAFYPHDWSPVCTDQLAVMQAQIDEIRSYDAEVIALSVDNTDSHRAWAERQDISFPLLSDFWPHGAVAEQYGVFRPQNGISERALFFIDKAGIIRKTWIGEHPGISPEPSVVLDALRELAEDS